MENKDSFISEKIRQFRVLKNHSQDDLAKALGLTKQAISRIELGKRKVSYFELSKIAEFLEEPIEAFVEEDIKFKLIREKYDVTALPKFAHDFLKDYKEFVKKMYSEEDVKLIHDEINKKMTQIEFAKFGDMNEIDNLH
ncbi:MAG: XRE family transcriptional regulator [Actinobacteria bacterium]|nr:MAG: XRE family transcriptional regulator [Actinomycetota bacterium]